jgi:signal recognition particle subunit SRP19
MRKLDKAIIWPAYFDSNKTRKQGRRVSRELAVQSPRIIEIEEAARSLGLEHELVLEKGYSRTPWFKGGMLLVRKKEPKEQLIKKIAKQLIKARNEPLRVK